MINVWLVSISSLTGLDYTKQENMSLYSPGSATKSKPFN